MFTVYLSGIIYLAYRKCRVKVSAYFPAYWINKVTNCLISVHISTSELKSESKFLYVCCLIITNLASQKPVCQNWNCFHGQMYWIHDGIIFILCTAILVIQYILIIMSDISKYCLLQSFSISLVLIVRFKSIWCMDGLRTLMFSSYSSSIVIKRVYCSS